MMMVKKSNYLIEQVLSFKNMNLAWQDVLKKKSAPGPDDWDVNRWNRNWEENLRRLIYQVRTNTYCPNPPKRIFIRKKGGGTREICLFNISDKVLQRAVLRIIEPIFDQRFLPCSHAYRSNHSCATAVEQVVHFRDRGLHWVFDADIARCFDSISHDILMERLQRIIKDWFIINLCNLWLKYSRKNQKKIGIPQGAVISPLWCNIYLHNLDARLNCAKWKLVRYADDFVILTKTEEKANQAGRFTREMLGKISLRISEPKTTITSFGRGFVFLGIFFKNNTFSYLCGDKRIRINGNKVKTLYRFPPQYY